MSNSALTTVAVLMPIRNEAQGIKTSLLSVLAQDYPHDLFQVLLIDGDSSDSTLEIAREVINEYRVKTGKAGPKVIVLKNPRKIVPIGMNIGIKSARADVIIRVDGHTMIAEDYVQECVKALRDSHSDNVGGSMRPRADNDFGTAVGIATTSPFGIGGSRFHYSEIEEWVDTVYLGAWPYESFSKFGLFDEELIRNQDDEFNFRVVANGGRILLSPKIRSYYKVRSNPKSLWHQYFQYGYWKIRVFQKHPRQMRIHHFIPFLLTSSILLSGILAIFSFLDVKILLFILGVYLFANLSASLWLAYRKGMKYMKKLPFVFAILHFGYGLGFQAGLIRFYDRWKDKVGLIPA